MRQVFKCLVSLFIFFVLHKPCSAQLQAAMEPRHKTVLENDYLRILDVNILPGDTTFLHRHTLPSVVVVLSNTKVGMRAQGGQAVISKSEAGSVSYAAYDEHPVYHRVWNDDTIFFHVMDIELLRNGAKVAPQTMNDKAILPIFSEKLVSAFKWKAGRGKSIRKKASVRPLLFICYSGSAKAIINDAAEEAITLSAGKFWWVNTGNTIQLTGDDNTGAGFVILELNP